MTFPFGMHFMPRLPPSLISSRAVGGVVDGLHHAGGDDDPVDAGGNVGGARDGTATDTGNLDLTHGMAPV